MPLSPGTFIVTDSEFIENEIPLMYFDIGDFRSSIVRCKFSENSHTSFTVNAKESVFIFEDSLWNGNSHIVHNFRQFTGDIFCDSNNGERPAVERDFQVKNTLSPEQCRITMQDSIFLDTYFKVNEPSPGIIGANGCMIYIARIVVNNVRMAAVHQRDLEGLILLRSGSMVISRLSLRSSGTVSLGVGVLVGNFTIKDSFLDDLRSGGASYTVMWVGSMIVHNVNLTHGLGFPLDEANLGATEILFSGISAHIEIRNAAILPSKWYGRSVPIFAIYSTLDVVGMSIQDQRDDALAYLIEAEGSVSNITVTNCELDFAVFYVGNYEILRISGVTVIDSIVGVMHNHGIFAGAPTFIIECIDFTARNVTAPYLVASKQSQIRLSNFSITDSHFLYLMKNLLNSIISIDCMAVRRTTAFLAFLYQGSLFLSNSVFEDITSNSLVIGGENAMITLITVTMKNITSPLGFSRFKERSQLTIIHCTFSHYQSISEEGFYHSTGSLSITDSIFHSFDTVFIQARSCSVYIENSTFQESRSKALSTVSASAYGGALACSDCLSVVVKYSSFFNVSAFSGGAIAVQSTGNTTWARILNSKFVMCTALFGGAVYVKNSSCLIENSQFIGNEAKFTGGAVDVDSDNEVWIKSSQFYRNSAHEGGAVKWSRAEVSIVNTTFQDNSAFYGPNAASYGVKLSGKVFSSNGTEASGYPLQLIFELQDHYGQLVATASTQYFKLAQTDKVTFLGNTATTINQGIFNFSQLTIYAQPDSTQEVMGSMSTGLTGERVALNASVDITFRECVPGEVRKADRCEYCFAGNVSFFPSDSECSYCPKHAFCPGGNVLVIDPNYWRNETNSTNILQCPLKTKCLGGEYSECAEGHTGQMCNECSEGYTRYRTIECESCGNRVFQWVKVCLLAIPLVGFHSAIRTASDYKYFILKEIINHAQLLSALSYIRVPYPAVIKYSLHSLSFISSLFITDLPISCFSAIQPEYAKAIIGSAMPLTLFLLLILFNRGNVKGTLVLCTSAMMFTPMISLTTQMPLLACQSVHSGEVLLADMKQKCWQGRHLLLVRTLVLSSVIVNVVFPFVLIATIAIISSQKFDLFFPLWLSGMKLRGWDLLMYAAKGMLISVLIVSMAVSQLCQVAYGFVVLIFVSVLAAGFNSYAYIHWKLFFLVEHSLVIVGVSMGLCAYFIYHSPSEGVTEWLVSALFLVLNIGYFGMCAKIWIFPMNLSIQEEVSISILVVPPNSMMNSLNRS